MPAPAAYSRASTGSPSSSLGVDRVEPAVLEPVRAQLVGEADAPALVPAQVDDDAALVGDPLRASGPAAGRSRSAASRGRRR